MTKTIATLKTPCFYVQNGQVCEGESAEDWCRADGCTDVEIVPVMD